MTGIAWISRMGAFHRHGVGDGKAVFMLKPMERVEASQPQIPVRPRSGPVWVHSKSQPSYLFHPWMDPCSPHEWPYDLQALRGTEDFDDIVAWYLRTHPALACKDLLLFDAELARCAGSREISVEVYNDIDTGNRQVWFTVWGYAEGEFARESEEIEAFREIWFSTPALSRLIGIVGVDARCCAFADRHLIR